MLDAAQREAFERDGVVRLPRAFPADAARAMEDAIWRFAGRRGMARDDPSTWVAGQLTGASPRLKARSTFAAPWTDVVTGAVDQLLDGEWSGPKPNGLLVSFPTPGVPWRVPHLLWHSDYSFEHRPEPLFGVKTFGIVNAIEPGGGATCVVAGSHRLVARYLAARTAEDRVVHGRITRARFLRSHPWLAELSTDAGSDAARNERFLREADVDGVPKRVAELCGEPGDALPHAPVDAARHRDQHQGPPADDGEPQPLPRWRAVPAGRS